MKRLCQGILLVFLLASSTLATDLYRVWVTEPTDAARLLELRPDPVVQLQDGYLVLLDTEKADGLIASGLQYQLLAASITREELAMDARPDRANVSKYNLIFEQDNLRLYRVDFDLLRDTDAVFDLHNMMRSRPTIGARSKFGLTRQYDKSMGDLDSLIALVSQDSLESYTYRLQAFYRRTAGTDSNKVAASWIADKFIEFGYDSVYLDSFNASLSGIPTDCENVVAVKVGSKFPNHQIVVGAHHDAVSSSPGADDNGSGTAGVLEFARVLKDVETDMTFIFITFDAEEYGLYGSWHYADNAALNGDSIVYMFNMDMLGYYENTNNVTVYSGSDNTFSQLYVDLADSLLGLNGFLSGTSGGSDHYPFSQNGYDVTFIIEYEFSSVYHSYQDSTSYMDFGYMTDLVKSGLAVSYYVNATAGPIPAVAFEYPSGVPDVVMPGMETSFPVAVTGAYDGVPVSGTGQLHYSIDGAAFVTVDMTETVANQYLATLPAMDCNSTVQFYISAEEATEGIYYDPDPSDPFTAIAADQQTVVFSDNFESDLGWTVYGTATDGQWDRGIPADGNRGDPPSDYDGSGRCYLTDNVAGNSDVDGSYTNLVSPTVDVSDTDEVRISYARWYHNSFGADPFNDIFNVYVSDDAGATWELAETVGPTEQASGGWYTHDIWLSDLTAAPTSQLQVRFEASDLGSGSVVEAAVDAFSVTAFNCDIYVFQITTDSLPDWTVDQPYSRQLEIIGGTGPIEWADQNLDLMGTGLSVSTAGMVSGIPNATGDISFTAVATDADDSTTTHDYTFTINPAVSVAAASLPDATVDEAYAHSLTATGGTGTMTWTVTDNGLDGTGLTLNPDGSLSGTPAAAGLIEFNAEAADYTGSSDQALFSLTVNASWLCGDVNGDGSGPNIADVTFFVAYLFSDGQAPPEIDAADIDGSGTVNVVDLTALVAYLFSGGAVPEC